MVRYRYIVHKEENGKYDELINLQSNIFIYYYGEYYHGEYYQFVIILLSFLSS